MPNVPELRRVQRHIRRYPEKYDQDVWICGTTACVAGRVALLNGWKPAPESNDTIGALVAKEGERNRLVAELAEGLLGLTPSQSSALFDGCNSEHLTHQIIDELCESGTVAAGYEES